MRIAVPKEIRNGETRVAVILAFAQGSGFAVRNLDFSPIKGPEGNIEYLIHIQKGRESQKGAVDVASVVAQAHGALA